jgi:ADP-heptose:LPS heptosyltransferase
VTIALIEHFGDIVACEPVVRHVLRTRPNACILWCLRAPYRELVDHNPCIDKVVIVDCLTEWILLRTSGIAGEFVDLHPRGRRCLACDFPLKKPEGEPGLNINNYYNFGGLLQAFSRSAGLFGLEISGSRLTIPAATVKVVDGLKLPDQFIVFHTKSNESERRWSDEKWTVLLESIRNEFEIFTIEIGLIPTVSSTSPRYRSLCGQVNLIELAEVIRRATLFVGIDSGPAHLANAVECPAVILLGRYHHFSDYFPYAGFFASGGADVLRTSEDLSSLAAEKVLEAVEKRLATIPEVIR